MKAKKNYVGIDVSAKELVVKIEKNGQLQEGVCCFSNDTAGHKKLVKYITKHKAHAVVCMEATGIYHFELALSLDKIKTVELMVVNPKAVKHFGIATMQRSKTDKIDAGVILHYLKTMPFVAWEAPNQASLELQAISRRLQQLKSEVTRENCREHVTEYSQVLAHAIQRDIEVNISHLKRRIALLEKKAIQVIQSCTNLNEQYQLLLSIKGLGQTSAIQVLSELVCLPKDLSATQWVAYAGLDPKACESGSSVNKPKRISRSGNKYLRTALYMPAWVAVQTEPEVTRFYETLIARGKKPLQAITAVMRKLLHSIWGILKNKTQWNAEKFYQANKTEKVA